MRTQIDLGTFTAEVVFKDIKNVHLSVYPPAGRVRIAAPERMSIDTIRAYAISKLRWIKEQRRQIQAQERETPRDYVERESQYLWGKRYLLQLIEHDAPPTITVTAQRLRLTVRPGTATERRAAIMNAWYRDQVRAAAIPLFAKWEPIIGERATAFTVRHMKTKWGSCSPTRRTIRLNTELAKKPPECLEYLVVHELVHLLEPTHNERFQTLMDRFLPNWRALAKALNRLPVRHEDWTY